MIGNIKKIGTEKINDWFEAEKFWFFGLICCIMLPAFMLSSDIFWLNLYEWSYLTIEEKAAIIFGFSLLVIGLPLVLRHLARSWRQLCIMASYSFPKRENRTLSIPLSPESRLALSRKMLQRQAPILPSWLIRKKLDPAAQPAETIH